MVIERLRRRDYDVVARVHAHGKHVFHVADDHAVASIVAHHLVLHLLPVAHVLFYEHLVHHAEVEAALRNFLELDFVVGHSTAPAAQRVCHPDYDGVAYVICRLERVLHGIYRVAGEDRHFAFYHRILEQLPVFGDLDALYLGAKHAYAVLFKYALFVQGDSTVERSLAAESKHYRVGLFLLYHLLDVLGVYRHGVNLVCKARVRLDGRDVGVDEHAFHAFLRKRL